MSWAMWWDSGMSILALIEISMYKLSTKISCRVRSYNIESQVHQPQNNNLFFKAKNLWCWRCYLKDEIRKVCSHCKQCKLSYVLMIHCHSKKFIRRKVLLCKKYLKTCMDFWRWKNILFRVSFFNITPVHTSSEQNILEVYPLLPSWRIEKCSWYKVSCFLQLKLACSYLYRAVNLTQWCNHLFLVYRFPFS